MKQNEDAAPSILDDVWRDAMRYRFVRVADGVRISHEAARDQCSAAGVPFLFKQWGEWQPVHPSGASIPGCGTTPQREPAFRFEHGHYFTKVGKKLAGRLLDGALHDGYPGA